MTRGEQVLFNLEIKKKRRSSIDLGLYKKIMFKKIIDLSQPTGLIAVPPSWGVVSAILSKPFSENIYKMKYLRIMQWEQKCRKKKLASSFYFTKP